MSQRVTVKTRRRTITKRNASAGRKKLVRRRTSKGKRR